MYLLRCDAHLAELRETAEQAKACHAARQAKADERAAKRGTPAYQVKERELAQLRQTYAAILEQAAAVRAAKKVTAQQQAATQPASAR